MFTYLFASASRGNAQMAARDRPSRCRSLTGGAPSVMRAVSCLKSICWHHCLKELQSADVISIACLGLLLYHPYLLFQAGFQLSLLYPSFSFFQRRY
ncbi:ComEC/Rec2 family competence protein [Bacillus licheniformis]|nr:ComEC/Rec2 family competence protein [Bacillus licheniformis]